MRFISLGVVVLAVQVAQPVPAADVRGRWRSEIKIQDGAVRASAYEFEVDGSKLTGTVVSERGSAEITEGKVSGNKISFVVVRRFNGREVKERYRGRVAGDEIRFTVTARGNTRAETATRVLPPTPRENLERRTGRLLEAPSPLRQDRDSRNPGFC